MRPRHRVVLLDAGGLLLGNIAQDSARPLADCLAGAIRGVRTLHEDTCDLAYRASPTSTVVAVRVGGGALEYLVLGDSTLLLAGQDGKTTAVTDDRLDQVGKQLRASVDRLPTGTPEHAAALAQYRDDLTDSVTGRAASGSPAPNHGQPSTPLPERCRWSRWRP
ncbi:hypothetical protein SALBM217S_03982 [Streptomyces griseoloalbus]